MFTILNKYESLNKDILDFLNKKLINNIINEDMYNIQQQNVKLYSNSILTFDNEDSTFKDVSFNNAHLLNFKWVNCKFIDCVFTETIFYDVTFVNCTFIGCNFENATFKYADFIKSSFLDCMMSKVSLVNVKVNDTTFEKCDFSRALINESQFLRNSLGPEDAETLHTGSFYDCDLSYITILFSKFDNFYFDDVSFQYGIIKACRFYNAYMVLTNLSHVEFVKNVIQFSKFQNSNFNHSNLSSSAFNYIDLSSGKCDFSFAIISDSLKLVLDHYENEQLELAA